MKLGRLVNINLGVIGRNETKMSKENFEESMKSLENIVTELENGNLNLDESVKKFEEGMKIAKQCNTILEDAEKKITILLEKDGELKEENFDAE